ncbi:reverse transcriptase [Penicillium argentinense]|uniref:Reverse transcriptase n=1 Tax=Penicillium argentinense TaxID=1131581 RepID=A0A9W9EYJ2_9EURO|nr:reverse transcriptase [Penicillium argentinense]KAJ5090264.1 reverse transcriptase [Penicillium argentinense]
MDPYLSRTLTSLTRGKIYELKKQCDVTQASGTVSRIFFASAKRLVPELNHDGTLLNIEHWVEQARFDTSIPTEKLEDFEDHLRNQLETYSRKHNLAGLYSHLLTEWMNPPIPTNRE